MVVLRTPCRRASRARRRKYISVLFVTMIGMLAAVILCSLTRVEARASHASVVSRTHAIERCARTEVLIYICERDVKEI